MVDTAFSYRRALIVCYFLQESFKVKENSLHEIWNADTAFLLGQAEWHVGTSTSGYDNGYEIRRKSICQYISSSLFFYPVYNRAYMISWKKKIITIIIFNVNNGTVRHSKVTVVFGISYGHLKTLKAFHNVIVVNGDSEIFLFVSRPKEQRYLSIINTVIVRRYSVNRGYAEFWNDTFWKQKTVLWNDWKQLATSRVNLSVI